jgi:hypothetical protein
LPIHLQNELFEVFEMLIEAKVEAATHCGYLEERASGSYDLGVEALTADHLRVLSREMIYTHDTGRQTLCVAIERMNQIAAERRRSLGKISGSRGKIVHQPTVSPNGDCYTHERNGE